MEHDRKKLDRIYIKDLFLRCIIGINPDERVKKQDVMINVVLFADLSKAGKTDSIEDTVNYKTVKNRVVELVESSQYFLLEKMAEEIACSCLAEPQVEAVRVLVEKPGALRFAKGVGIEIFREK